jgi:hypothetical protein
MNNGDGRPIVAVDIDGTLAEYHGYFLRFAELWYGRPMPAPTEINPGEPLWKFMGVTRASYRECKLAYRQGGLKRSMPVLHNAANMIAFFRRKACLRSRMGDGCFKHGLGAEVWICTTRPYLRLDNIDPDTREWLRRNGIKYDALLFDPVGGDNKYGELRRQAAGRVAAVLEDLPEQADRALRLGCQGVFLREQPYNKHYEPPADKAHLFARWQTSAEATNLVMHAIRGWRMRNELS